MDWLRRPTARVAQWLRRPTAWVTRWLRRPTAWVTLLMVGVAAVAVGVWLRWNAADEWMPHLATLALGVAATITIVEWIVRREARERFRPWRERVLGDIRFEYRTLVEGVVIDYAGTHLLTARPIESDALAFLDQWLEDADSADACSSWLLNRETTAEARGPLIVLMAADFANRLSGFRERDREVMEPDLVAAIDQVTWHVGLGLKFFEFSCAPWTDDKAGQLRGAERTIVEGAREFGDALLRHDPLGRIEFNDLTLRAAESHREGVRRHGERIISAPHPEPWH